MQPAGWYPDPAGVPGRHRYWDGQQWREEVTFDDSAPLPGSPGAPTADSFGGPASGPEASSWAGPGGASGPNGPGRPIGSGGPGASKGPKVALIVGIAAVAVILVIVLAVAVPRMLGNDPTEPTDPPVTQPTGPASEDGPANDELNCAGANGVAASDAGTHFESTGASVTTPDDWPFRFDKSQWSWLDDQSAFGKIHEDDSVEGMAFGGLRGDNGFVDPEEATEQVVTCLNRYGIYNQDKYPQEEVSSEEVEYGGMTGWQRVVDFDEGDNVTRVTIIVLDSGQPNRLVCLTTFAPPDTDAHDRVTAVAESLKKL